jgi:hypothetical protein
MTTQKTPPTTNPTPRETTTPRTGVTEPTQSPRTGRIDEEEEEDIDTTITDAERTNTPGKNNPEEDPEVDPQRIDPNRTEENPGKQRERERNPETDTKPRR